MKSYYQYHDPVLDKGKAEPHENRPTTASRKPVWYRVTLDTDNYWQDVKGTIHRRDCARQHKRAARRQRAFRPQQFPVLS